MAQYMGYDEIKQEQESQRGFQAPAYDDGHGHDRYYSGPGDGDSPDRYYAGPDGGSIKGRCLHCGTPGHQWRACQCRCAHCSTFEHSYIPQARASTQCPALLAKDPYIYDKHSYRHTLDHGNAYSRAQDVCIPFPFPSHSLIYPSIQISELSHMIERFLHGLRRENEGLRNDLIRAQRHNDLLEQDLRETRERYWVERNGRERVEEELKEEDALREQSNAENDGKQSTTDMTGMADDKGGIIDLTDEAEEDTPKAASHSDRLRRLHLQRQRRTRRYQSEAQRRLNERTGYQVGGNFGNVAHPK